MKRFLALTIFAFISQSTWAASLCPIMYGPPPGYGPPVWGQPDRYPQYLSQCADTTVTAAQEFACMEAYVAGDPPLPLLVAEVTAYFKRGCTLIKAVQRGLLSDGEAKAQFARNMAYLQRRIQEKVLQRLHLCYYTRCNSARYSTFCNGY
jgi:hypothetical protein